jgi:DNA-directed RNA polymerases I, II, and III subunit RPABC1
MDIDDDDRPKLSEEAEKELTRLWRTWRTVNEMLLDRVRRRMLASHRLMLTRRCAQGYEISNDEVNISRPDFQLRFGERDSGFAEYVEHQLYLVCF